MTKATLVNHIYTQLKKLGYTKEEVRKCVHVGDPFGWAPNAHFTIINDGVLPGMYSEGYVWDGIDLGDMYIECVNGGVMAVYDL